MTDADPATNADPTGLRAYIFGDRALDQWPPEATDTETSDTGPAYEAEPWASFIAARDAYRAGDIEAAVARWQAIAALPNLESRQVLRAWHFLRLADQAPSPDQAKVALGAVAEVAVPGGHDLLAAYADRSVRYLNVSGAAVIVDDRLAALEAAVTGLLDVAQQVADAIGPWEEAALPDLPVGHTRITVLTPSGPHLGQGPDEALRNDAMASAFLLAATTLLVAVTELPRS